MVDSVNAASRVGALVLSLVVFAAMWESDSPPAQSKSRLVIRTGECQGTTQSDAVLQSRRHAAESSSFGTLLPTSLQTPQTSVVSFISSLSTDGDLPHGIAPGRYRVVDSDGMVDSIVISHSTSGSQRPVQAQSFYTQQLGSRTRYFIRIESSESGVAATELRTLR
jgi:hypothetical protein